MNSRLVSVPFVHTSQLPSNAAQNTSFSQHSDPSRHFHLASKGTEAAQQTSVQQNLPCTTSLPPPDWAVLLANRILNETSRTSVNWDSRSRKVVFENQPSYSVPASIGRDLQFCRGRNMMWTAR